MSRPATSPMRRPLQWAVGQEVQSAVPDARVYLRERVLSWRDDREAPRLRVVTALGFPEARAAHAATRVLYSRFVFLDART